MVRLSTSLAFLSLERVKILFFPMEISENIFLGELSFEQTESYFQIVQDNRTYFRQWLSWVDTCSTVEGTVSLIEGMLEEERERIALRLTLLAGYQAIGGIWVYSIDWEVKSCKLGYWVVPKYQGRGLITLGCEKVISLLFKRMGMQYIMIECSLENIRSQLIAQRLGFFKNKVLKNNEWLYDHYIDHIQYLKIYVA